MLGGEWRHSTFNSCSTPALTVPSADSGLAEPYTACTGTSSTSRYRYYCAVTCDSGGADCRPCSAGREAAAGSSAAFFKGNF